MIMEQGILSYMAKGTSIVTIFRGGGTSDAAIRQYRAQYVSTGYVLSDGQRSHLYPLGDQGWLPTNPKYSITRSRPKCCVTCQEHVLELIRFFLDNITVPKSQVQWGASPPALRELGDTLHALGFSLIEDGHMVEGVFPHKFGGRNVGL